MVASFLIPTRKRVPYLRTAIESIVATARASEYEILIAMDDDDEQTTAIRWDVEYYPKVKTCITKRWGYDGLHEYYNILASMAQGRWLVVWNDDCVMKTEGWDEILKEHDGEFVLLNPLNMEEQDWTKCFTMFPILPIKWYQTLGRISAYNHTDDYIDKMTKELGMFTHEHRIRFDHPKDRLKDETGREIRYHRVRFPKASYEEDKRKIKKVVESGHKKTS